ncbi:MAG: UvrB/UvrC motif-containing protein, partial [Clostridia bacterium]|nr:UvrB/UvrC motif-containing protein [Clostridia bacterium]
ALQEKYNEKNGITPESVKASVKSLLEITDAVEGGVPEDLGGEEKDALIRQLEDQMLTAAGKMEFEKAAKLRDQLFALRGDKVPERSPVRHRREKMRHH